MLIVADIFTCFEKKKIELYNASQLRSEFRDTVIQEEMVTQSIDSFTVKTRF